MSTIGIYIEGADATIKPVNVHRVGVEIEGISLSELVESVDDTPELLDVIGEKILPAGFPLKINWKRFWITSTTAMWLTGLK
ncbi:hypothetical protein ACE61L_003423 [Salmonella enterica]